MDGASGSSTPPGETSLTPAHEARPMNFRHWLDDCASHVNNIGTLASEQFSQLCVGHDSSVSNGSGPHLDSHTDLLPKATQCNEYQHQQLISGQLEEERTVLDLSAHHGSTSLVETSPLRMR